MLILICLSWALRVELKKITERIKETFHFDYSPEHYSLLKVELSNLCKYLTLLHFIESISLSLSLSPLRGMPAPVFQAIVWSCVPEVSNISKLVYDVYSNLTPLTQHWMWIPIIGLSGWLPASQEHCVIQYFISSDLHFGSQLVQQKSICCLTGRSQVQIPTKSQPSMVGSLGRNMGSMTYSLIPVNHSDTS